MPATFEAKVQQRLAETGLTMQTLATHTGLPEQVTRQLLTERAGKTGLVRIKMTFCWDSQRLRSVQ